jgi:preprotein translocase subunit SecA
MLNKLGQIIQRLRGGAIELSLRPYERLLGEINRHEDDLRRFTDDRLQLLASELKQRLLAGEDANKCLPQVFALAREVADRVLRMRPYGEQMMAGAVLHQGKVVQMQTGEGKTLAAVAPVVLNGLTGRGVHVLTFNDYLAERDAGWMRPVFRFLGMTVGHVAQGMPLADRRAAYERDVTYITAKEAGFDFLRDQQAMHADSVVHRDFHFAIVDEADSILIDEARVPLVIAGDTDEEPVDLSVLAHIMRDLKLNEYYEIGDRARNAHFTSAGLDYLEQQFECGDLHDERRLPLLARLNQALHAECLLHRDVDYIVRDGEVLLLDELTGRVAENRRWPYGLQAAVEAKEGQPIQPDGKILNSITLQHFVSMYDKLSGMTGTAEEAAEEFHDFYGLRVALLPTHEPCIREDEQDEVYATREAKVAALVRVIDQLRQSGQPVLVGTASVRESDHLADQLRSARIPFQVLNAKNDHEEAKVIADAGTFGAVTISTNMAGRGTDIKLGGHDEHDRGRVVSLGGLYVVGTNRHESRRIDNQLRGRSARQGDPGHSHFIVSLEDDLLSRFGLADSLRSLDFDEESEQPLDGRQVTEKVAHIQRVVEGECFEIRRTLRKYAEVLESQRKTIATKRRSMLLNDSPTYILTELAAGRYQDLAERFGDSTLREVERQITLFQIDKCWADHLAHIAEIRESIYLVSMGGLDPLFEFQKRASAAYRKLLKRIDDAVVRKFNTVEITADGIDLESEGLLGPSSTWTYMINDHPIGDVFERISRSVKRLLSRG